MHREIVGGAFGDPDWVRRSALERTERLGRALAADESPFEDLTPAGKRALWVFEAMEFCRKRFGEPAVGTYVVSMAQDIDDVLSVLLLARWAGMAEGPGGQVPLDVAPLFESVDALEEAGAIIARLLADPEYRKHLADRGNRQAVMLGYSDSNKSAGIVASRWLLRRAQEAMVAACDAAGVQLVVFHGRGASIGRGSGRMEGLVRGMPQGAVRGTLRETVQGEAVNERYGLRPIALRSFEQTLGAVMLTTAGILRAGTRGHALARCDDRARAGQQPAIPGAGSRRPRLHGVLPGGHAGGRHRADADRLASRVALGQP